MMLDPLDRPGVIEAIEGPAEHFGLVISPDRNRVEPGETTLADFMSHDLFDTLANPQTEQESPIAPTLQILLTRMWKEANDPKRLRGRPTLDRDLYQKLKGKGFKLDEVIQEQFARIAEVEGLREAVEEGLLLDMLEFFTTHEGTADTHTREEIHKRYHPHQPAAQLDALLEACQNRYLLAHVGVGEDGSPAYRLTHDTLAPLLRERFRVSPDLAQRARHVLEGRAATWKGRSTDSVLDRVDLASVEEGLLWMRALEKDEPALLEASRRAEERRVAEEAERQRQLREARGREEQARRDKEDESKRRLKEQEEANRRQQEDNRRLRKRALWLLGALAATVVFAGLAVWQGHEATKSAYRATKSADEAKAQTRLAVSRSLAASSDILRPERLDLAMLLALEAAKEGDTLEARGSLQRALDWRPEVVRFLHVPEGDVTSVAFGPEGQIAAGFGVDARGYVGGVVLFDARGERLRPAPLEVKEGGVMSVAFGPESKIAAGYGDGVVLFDARGERLRPDPLEVKEGHVASVAFGPEGQIAAGYGDQGGGGVVLFDARGEQLRPTPLEVKEGFVSSVAFGPEGQIAAGYSGVGGGFGVVVGGGGVVLFDARGERLRPTPLEVKEGQVRSVAFGPEGQIAAGYGVFGGVVLFDARGERLRPAPLEVKEGEVSSVAFGPEGQIAAGYRGGVVLFDADPASWLRKAGQTANRNFMWDEWKRYLPDETPYRRTIRSLPWPHDLPEAERKQAEAFEKEHPEGSDAS